METIMATHHWVPHGLGGHYDSDEDYGYEESDFSDIDWLPTTLIF